VACGRFFSGRLNYPGISQEEETHLRLSYYSSNLSPSQSAKPKRPKLAASLRASPLLLGKRDVTNFPAPTKHMNEVSHG
jgi:hypothetical protein